MAEREIPSTGDRIRIPSQAAQIDATLGRMGIGPEE
jgi:hypothetical protein